MSYKSNIDAQLRGFYFAPNGKDTFSGETLEVPKQSIQAAIDAAGALIPIPSATNQGFVTAAQGGEFTDPIVCVDSVSINATDANINADTAIVITTASILQIIFTVIQNSQAAGICVKIEDNNLLGVDLLFIGVLGDSGIGCQISGTLSDIFIDVRLVSIFGDGGVGFDITGIITNPMDINIGRVNLLADDATFMVYNPTSGTCAINLSSIVSDGFTNTTAFSIESGRFIVESCGLIDADTAIHVLDGAIMDVFADTVEGDITVDVGGELNCVILNHLTGALTNNGTINGIINGKRFGSYLPQVVLIAESFTNQDPTGLDTPLQVEFGAAQGTVSDPVMIDAAGVLTVNETGRYRASLFAQYGRSGAGSASWLFFRGLRNGLQEQVSVLAKLDNANSDLPIQFEVTRKLEAGDVLVFQVIRDSQGFDSGGLISESPTPAGWLDSPSAHITMIKE